MNVIKRMIWVVLVAWAFCVATGKEIKPTDQHKTDDETHRHIYSGGFANDFTSSSVDRNQDGQPDNYQTYKSPSVPYSFSPFSSSTNAYQQANNPSVVIPISLTDLSDLYRQIASLTGQMAELQSQMANMAKPVQDPVAGLVPTGCNDLQTLGWTQNGFYTVQGSANKVGTVFCDFTKTPKAIGYENVIGFNDVKTTPVYFHVGRKSSYNFAGTVIPFETDYTNVGGAMTTSTGIFIAPTSGQYSFSLTGLAHNGGIHIRLQLNGVKVGTGYSWYDMFGLEALLSLKRGDRVTLFLQDGAVNDNNDDGPYMHFTGKLLEEDLSF